MNDPFDFYSDGFSIGIGPETANLSFSITPVSHGEDEDEGQPRMLGTVRMGIRQLRAITFSSWELIRRMEREGLVPPQPEPPDGLIGPETPIENWRLLWFQGPIGQSEAEG